MTYNDYDAGKNFDFNTSDLQFLSFEFIMDSFDDDIELLRSSKRNKMGNWILLSYLRYRIINSDKNISKFFEND